MKDEIPEFLQKRLKMKFSSTKNFSDEIKQFMTEYAQFYKWHINDIKIIFKAMKRDISILPICKHRNCDNLVRINSVGVLTNGCCIGHSNKIKMQENYGVDNISQIPETIIKREKTCLEKYGVANVMKNEEIKNKLKKSNIDKYGVDNPMKVSEISSKLKVNMLEKYGVSNISSLESNKVKVRRTMIDRYGSTTFLHSTFNDFSLTVDKIRNTTIERYGVINVMQVPTIYSKQQSSMFKRKEYKWGTGEVSMVQGYEPIVLKELEEKGYKFHEVLTFPNDMPRIVYNLNGKEHRYFPDIYIPNENLIIEVKSDYTLNLQKEKNEAKFSATKALGYNFKVEVR